MRQILFYILLAVVFAACQKSQTLEERAAELCAYIPDHELLQKSRDYMTEDFYAVLDTMFYQLPQHEALDHEWLYYFVTGNGGTIADYEVVKVEQTDRDHALATISVRQVWEDGSFDPPFRQVSVLISSVGVVAPPPTKQVLRRPAISFSNSGSFRRLL